MKTFSTLLLALVALIFPILPATAQVLEVPAQYPTIQDAIDAALDGDVVLVSDGIYNEGINFLGKAIEVRGQSQEFTILDGSGVPTNLVRFVNDEGNSSKLARLTLRNGSGTSPGGANWGAGIFCLGSSPTIEDVTVHDCGNGSAYGEGPGLWFGSHTQQVVVRRCVFFDNLVDGYGGAICGGGDVLIEDCKVFRNQALFGGGLWLYGPATIRRCEIVDNLAAKSAGVALAGTCSISDSIIACNRATTPTLLASSSTGGICGGYRNAGGIGVGGIVTMSRSIVWRNEAGHYGSAINCQTYEPGNPCAQNGFPDPSNFEPSITLNSCIVWANSGGFGAYTFGGTIDADSSCVQPGLSGGTQNVSVDPQFCGFDPRLRIEPTSPLVGPGIESGCTPFSAVRDSTGETYTWYPSAKFSDAIVEAIRTGSELLEFRDELEENWFEQQFGMFRGHSYVHLGYSDFLTEGSWESLSGEPRYMPDWQGGQPNNDNNLQHFAWWYQDGTGGVLYDGENDQAVHPFVLRQLPGRTSSVLRRNPVTGHYYFWVPDMTFLQAQVLARSLGGYVLSLEDQAEVDWIQATFPRTRGLWLGLTDSDLEGTYVWESGALLTGSANWAPNEPANTDANDGAALLANGEFLARSLDGIGGAIIELPLLLLDGERFLNSLPSAVNW